MTSEVIDLISDDESDIVEILSDSSDFSYTEESWSDSYSPTAPRKKVSAKPKKPKKSVSTRNNLSPPSPSPHDISFSLSLSPEKDPSPRNNLIPSRSSSPLLSDELDGFLDLKSPIEKKKSKDTVQASIDISEKEDSPHQPTPNLRPALQDNDDFFINPVMPRFEFSDSEDEDPLNNPLKSRRVVSKSPSPVLPENISPERTTPTEQLNQNPGRKRSFSLSPLCLSPVSKSQRTISSSIAPVTVSRPPSISKSSTVYGNLLASEPQDLDPLLLEVYKEVFNGSESCDSGIKEQAQTTPLVLGKCRIRCNFPRVDGVEESIIPTPKFHMPIEFAIKVSDNFEQMFYFICQNKKMVLSELVVEYNGLKIYPRTTPVSLGIVKDTTTVFEVYNEKSHLALTAIRLEEEFKRFASDTDANLPAPEVEQPELISLTVRSPKNKDDIFKLKETTVLNKIIESIRQSRKLGPDVKMILEFDGEKLNLESTVQEAGLEDEDMINLLVI